jgi:O-methyltransferase
MISRIGRIAHLWRRTPRAAPDPGDGRSAGPKSTLESIAVEEFWSSPAHAFERLTPGMRSAAERAAFFNAVIKNAIPADHSRVFWGDRLISLDKACGFLDDEKFRQSFEAVRGSHVYDQYDSPHTIAWRLHTLVWAARCAIAHEGDFVECGVFKGDMAWVVATNLGTALDGRTFYLYDSFEGFSPTLSVPEDYPENPGFLEFANKVYREPGLHELVTRRFASMPNIRVIRGFLPESLRIAMPSRIAFLHVDLNSPAAEVGVLEILFDRVVPGGMIVFDDYGWHVFRKQRLAEDRFMAERGHAILELPTGQGLVVKHEG